MHPWEQPRYKFMPFFDDKIPFAVTKCISLPPHMPSQYFLRSAICTTFLQSSLRLFTVISGCSASFLGHTSFQSPCLIHIVYMPISLAGMIYKEEVIPEPPLLRYQHHLFLLPWCMELTFHALRTLPGTLFQHIPPVRAPARLPYPRCRRGYSPGPPLTALPS